LIEARVQEKARELNESFLAERASSIKRSSMSIFVHILALLMCKEKGIAQIQRMLNQGQVVDHRIKLLGLQPGIYDGI
jgi:hypothetical protein